MQNLKAVPLGFQQIVAADLAAAKSLTVPTGANMAVISAETAGVRWRDDGVAPTATVGMPIAAAAAPFEYWGNLGAIQFIAQSGSPVLDVAYYRIAG